MTAVIVVTSKVKNPEKMQEYAQKAAATFGAFGGELMVRGAFERALIGDGAHNGVAVQALW